MTAVFTSISSELLAGGCRVRFRAEGGSMYPTIRDGEVVTVAPIDVSRVRGGDILLCDNRGRIIAHRVIAIEPHAGAGRRFTLRGDGAASADAPIGAGHILGRVVSVERGGRQVRLGRWRPAAIRLVERCALRVAAGIRRTIPGR